MKDKAIYDLASQYGLTIETVHLDGHDNALRVYKGANQIFIGTADAVRAFLADYEKQRPGPMEGSMYGYRE